MIKFIFLTKDNQQLFQRREWGGRLVFPNPGRRPEWNPRPRRNEIFSQREKEEEKAFLNLETNLFSVAAFKILCIDNHINDLKIKMLAKF